MHTIKIEDARFFAFHGCLPEEAKIGGEYRINLEVKAEVSNSFKSDDLHDTVDYVKLYEILKEEMAIRSKLIEHVADRIMRRIAEECKEVQSAKIELRKLQPPIGGDVAAVSVEWEENFIRT